MKWFSQAQPNRESQILIGEFPSWTALNSAKLVNELKPEDLPEWTGILKDDATKLKFINCLIGVHLFYLTDALEGGILDLLGGEETIKKLLSSVPEESRGIFLMVFSFVGKKPVKGTPDEWLSSLEEFYKIKIDPLDAYPAFVIEQHMFPHLDEFSGLVRYLLPILNRLRVSQLEWLGDMVQKWSKNNVK